MTALSMLGASGMAAACTRPLTAPAPASTAAVPRKPLRDNMVRLLCDSMGGGGGLDRRRGARLRHCGVAAADDGGEQIGAGEPEVALGVDRRDGRIDALPCLGQQRELIELHGAVA